MGIPGTAAGGAGAATPRHPADASARRVGGHRGAGDRHLPAGEPRRLEPHRPHLGEAFPPRLRSAQPVSRRRPREVLRRRRMTPALRVIPPGLLTTIQDQGRPHAIASGVPPGGAMDRFAHAAANLLVWNDPSAATLECTVTGPRLVAERACVIAITGADLAPRLHGQDAPIWTSIA